MESIREEYIAIELKRSIRIVARKQSKCLLEFDFEIGMLSSDIETLRTRELLEKKLQRTKRMQKYQKKKNPFKLLLNDEEMAEEENCEKNRRKEYQLSEHQSRKLFKCSFKNCHQKFTHKYELVTHQKVCPGRILNGDFDNYRIYQLIHTRHSEKPRKFNQDDLWVKYPYWFNPNELKLMDQ
ncbi:hypothetical protein NH340_JMT00170 [Sarcoptes scabiei]|nr:hypothetical protein NH340_JMT00170 [Sarcoptes scabiei]